jgi:hypothetical protein
MTAWLPNAEVGEIVIHEIVDGRKFPAIPDQIQVPALRWLAKSSVPMSALEEARMVSRAAGACARKLDGTAAAAQYYRRRRRVFYAALKLAVRDKHRRGRPAMV